MSLCYVLLCFLSIYLSVCLSVCLFVCLFEGPGFSYCFHLKCLWFAFRSKLQFGVVFFRPWLAFKSDSFSLALACFERQMKYAWPERTLVNWGVLCGRPSGRFHLVNSKNIWDHKINQICFLTKKY